MREEAAESGADGGHVGALTINGTTYTYNPASGGSISVSGGPNNGSFTTSSNTLTVTTATGGSLAVDMDDGAFTYTPPATISAMTSYLSRGVPDVVRPGLGDVPTRVIVPTVPALDAATGTASERWDTIGDDLQEERVVRTSGGGERVAAAAHKAEAECEELRRQTAEDGKRVAKRFMLVAHPIPAGNLAAYFPETNALVPLSSVAVGADTPTSKAVPVVLAPHQP